MRRCPICHSPVPVNAKKCRHCHNYLGFSFSWVWEEGLRVLSLLATVAAAVVAWKSLEMTIVAQREQRAAEVQTVIAHQEKDALKEDYSERAEEPRSVPEFREATSVKARSANEAILIQQAADCSDLRVRKALALALKLKQAKVQFKMGGKSPEEGFDSSGFVSYLLAEAGAVDPMYHRTFSVSKLESSFVQVKASKAKAGDLAFLGKGYVAMLIDTNLAIGIGNSKGIQIFSFENSKSDRSHKSIRRWAYEQDVKSKK